MKINDEFVSINKENAQRLKRIPLIIPATTENLEILKQYGDDVVIYAGIEGHQYSMEFNDYGNLETHGHGIQKIQSLLLAKKSHQEAL